MNKLTVKQQKRIALLAVLGLILVIGFLCVLIGGPMIRFASDPELFRQWVERHGLLGKLTYMLMVILQVVLAIIPGEPLEIVGGYAFGAVEGTILCLLAGGLGSTIVFLAVRRFGLPLAEIFFSRDKLQSLRFLHSSPRRTVLFLLIFMIPGTPKDLLCYFAGLTNMRLPVLILICTLGRLPSVVTSTVGGNALGSEQYIFAVLVFAGTFLLSICGLAIYNQLCKRRGSDRQTEQ